MEEMKDSKSNIASFKPYLFVFIKLSGWIFPPVLVGVIVGGWLDEKYKTQPWLFLLCVGVAFLISMAGLVISASKMYKNIDTKK